MEVSVKGNTLSTSQHPWRGIYNSFLTHAEVDVLAVSEGWCAVEQGPNVMQLVTYSLPGYIGAAPSLLLLLYVAHKAMMQIDLNETNTAPCTETLNHKP